MFDNLFKRAPAPTVHVAEVKRPEINLKKATFGEFRNGMWVAVGELNRIGILTDANEFGIANVTLVREDGTNLLVVHAPLAELRQATHKEIPAARRPHAIHAAALGYKVG